MAASNSGPAARKSGPLFARREGDKQPKLSGIHDNQQMAPGTRPEAGDPNLLAVRHKEASYSTTSTTEDQEENAAFAEWLGGRLNQVAGTSEKIGKKQFQKVLGVRQSFFAERFFDQFDRDNDGNINRNEIEQGLNVLVQSSPKEKLKVLFDFYDLNGNGYLSADELETVLKACMKESSLKLTQEELDRLTVTLMEAVGKGEANDISFDEFYATLQARPELLNNLNISATQWLKPTEQQKKSGAGRNFSMNYMRNNASRIVFWLFYTLINIGLFTLSMVRYRHTNWCLMLARGNGMCLNFNSAVILVPMLRYSLTWLRSVRIAALIFPLDDSVLVHKVIGVVIFIQSVAHTLAHFGNLVFLTTLPGNNTEGNYTTSAAPSNASAPLAYWEFLFTCKGPLGWLIPGFAFISGDILLVILIIMVLCSLPCIRRSGKFEVFFWTHKLYIAYWIFLFLHGPIFWYFFIAPLIIYVLELIIYNRISRRVRYGKTYITNARLLPSQVTHLVMTKPEGFHYHPGDYIFVNIPNITYTEWHPFTISSAPEMPDSVWLHVRTLGHWTEQVYNYFESIGMERVETGKVKRTKKRMTLARYFSRRGKQPDVETSAEMSSATVGTSNVLRRIKRSGTFKQKKCKVEVLIDGPYGTPTRDIFQTEHAVLIASGIGVTPFASILQSIMFRYRSAKHRCPKCETTWYGDLPPALMNLKRVNFIWINRDQKSFEWFVSLLAHLEMEQAEEGSFEHFLDMQMFMTSATSASDMKGLGLQLAMEVLHEKQNVDLITGLRTRTQPGRPDWDKVFGQIDANKKGKVKIFFCGNPVLGNVIKKHCDRYGFGFSKETF